MSNFNSGNYKQAEDEIKCKVVGVTKPVIDEIPDSEAIISYAARVSNPKNQLNFDSSEKLLKYCIKHSHWSVFETVSLTMEIEAPRDIARQILRHRSFSFQEFSQRYAEAQNFVLRECRMQDPTNRQNSFKASDDASLLEKRWQQKQDYLLSQVLDAYTWAIDQGIAKEVARVVLPEGLTMSRMYMNGTLRSWLHYIDLREKNGTQLEHVWVAKKCKDAIEQYFPTLISMLKGENNG